MVILLSTAALLVSILVLWSNLCNRRQQRQIIIAQKRTELLVAMHDIELALEPTIRDWKRMLTKSAPPAHQRQKGQSILDEMIDLLDTTQLIRKQLTDRILPGASSHKVLLSIEALMAQMLPLVEDARSLKADFETQILKLNEMADSKHES